MSPASTQTQLTLSQSETSEEAVIQLHESGYGAVKISNRTGWSMSKVKHFLRRRGFFNESRCNMEKIRRIGEKVREKYENTAMTMCEISNELGVNKDYAHGAYKLVTDRVGERSIRKDGQLHKLTQKKIQSPDVDFYTANGYEYICGVEWEQVTSREGVDKNEQLLTHRLVAVAEYGFDAVADSQVHHKNGIPWDNRPENLEPVNEKTHMNKHWHKDPLVSQLASASDEDVIEGLLNAGYYDAALAVENGGDS